MIYKFVRVIFGLRTSPFQALACLRKLAQDHIHSHPDAARLLLDSFYIDDFLSSHASEEKAKHVSLELIALLKLGSFPLTKFNSSSKIVLDSLPASDSTDAQARYAVYASAFEFAQLVATC